MNKLFFTLSILPVLIFLPLTVNCQSALENDTIKINEVIISLKNMKDGKPFYEGNSIDSTTLLKSGHKTLAELISENTNIAFKGYGGGGSATISIRGTGAGHTLLEWNGISINHPMLGQADFSLVPASAADGINILYGNTSMKNSNGGIGGVINMETKPVWDSKTPVSISTGYGSFGSFTGAAAVRIGSSHFQSSTKAFFNNSKNNFRFLNTETDAVQSWETMKESRVRTQGLIQELYYRRNNSLLAARLWYQSSNRELPSSMLTFQPGLHEKQKDESFRSMLSYNAKRGINEYSITGVLFTNKLDYTNNLASIDSRNRTRTAVIKAGFESRPGEELKISAFISNEINTVRSNNYSGVTTRNITTVIAMAEKKFHSRLGATILFREIADGKNLLVPDYSAGLKYQIIKRKDYFFKATVARNSKLPSMNDLYWYPGGNLNLKNEYASQYELSFELTDKITPDFSFDYSVTGFRYLIRDMVLWIPGEFSFWTADNIQTVNSAGLETSLRFIYTNRKFVSKLNTGYSFTRSVSDLYGNGVSNYQLPYIPVHQAYAALQMTSGIFYSAWSCNLTGKRYTAADNSGYLQGYILNNLTAGVELKSKAYSVDISFRTENLFNQSYQAIAHYPMPGRAYYLNLTINLINI